MSDAPKNPHYRGMWQTHLTHGTLKIDCVWWLEPEDVDEIEELFAMILGGMRRRAKVNALGIASPTEAGAAGQQ